MNDWYIKRDGEIVCVTSDQGERNALVTANQLCDYYNNYQLVEHTHADPDVLDENAWAARVAKALGIEYQGEHFDEMIKEVACVREDAQILAELVEPIGLTERQQQALKRISGIE